MGYMIPGLGYTDVEEAIIPGLGYVKDIVTGNNPIAVNDAYDIIDGVQKVVSAPGILDNDTFECN